MTSSPVMLESPARTRPLDRLRQAKWESDRRNYPAKNEILRGLLRELPHKFIIDSENDHVYGLTHTSTGFKIHMPKHAVPGEVRLRRLKHPETPEEWDTLQAMNSLSAVIPQVQRLKKAAYALDSTQDGYSLWYQPEDDLLRLHAAPEDMGLVAGEMTKYAEVYLADSPDPVTRFDEPWILIKKSFSPTLRGITDVTGFSQGPSNAWYGGPKPLAATLIGGLAGAGMGYVGGALGETLGGGHLQKKRLRKTMALLGAGLGAAPGALWGLYNTSQIGPKGFFSPYPGSGPEVDAETKAYNAQQAKLEKPASAFPYEIPLHYRRAIIKAADYTGSMLSEPLPVDAFNRVIWARSDPFTPTPLRAATTGLIESASALRGNSPIVTVGDIARIGLGMGSGYMAANLAGKALGALAGLSPEAQSSLQQAGTWAGVLKAVIPGVFGG